MTPIDPGLEGKRILITGASRGIGAAVARLFAASGARLVLHHRRDPAEAADIPHVALVRADFADRSAPARTVEAALSALGGLDLLVNNAGHLLGRVSLDAMDDEAFDRVLDLNARSVVAASRAALPALRRSRGQIINVTSIAARTGGSAGSALYASAKAFVSTFTRAMATELAVDGIRVNAVSPGTIATEFHEVYSTPEKLEATRQRIPLRRLGRAEDCAGAFLFLASERLGGYVTGQILEVNGGQLMP